MAEKLYILLLINEAGSVALIKATGAPTHPGLGTAVKSVFIVYETFGATIISKS
jgi:hypothetical protein